ncbi:MAG: hypothetical protein AAF627_13085 [Myxococcota bacterium]
MKLLLLWTLAAAPEVTVDMRPVDGHLLDLGRPTDIVLELRHPGPGVAVWPEPLELPEEMELESRRVERARAGEQVVDRLYLRVRPFLPGPQSLAPFGVQLGETDVQVPATRFHVRSPLPEELAQTLTATALSPELAPRLEAMMAPDTPPPVPSEWDPVALLSLGGLAGVLVVALSLVGWSRRRRPAVQVEVPDLEAETIQALDELLGSIRAQPEGMPVHHARLSSLLRRSVGLPDARKGEALDKSELSAAFRPSEARARLIRILETADWVRFARTPASVSNAERTVAEAKVWIRDDLHRLETAPRKPRSTRPPPAAWPGPSVTPPPSPGYEKEAGS